MSLWPAGLSLLRPALAGWPVSAWSVVAAGAALLCLCASVPPRLCLRASQIDNKLRREIFTTAPQELEFSELESLRMVTEGLHLASPVRTGSRPVCLLKFQKVTDTHAKIHVKIQP